MSGFYQRFAQQVERFGSRMAVQIQRKEAVDRFTYEDLDRLAAECATLLARRGIRPGDRCALLAENDAHWIAGYLGALRLGAVAVPLDTAYEPAQVQKLLADSGARAILTSPRYLATASQARAGLDLDCVCLLLHPPDDGSDGGRDDRLEVLGRTEFDPAGVAPVHDDSGAADTTAVILYTSGTTSDPKGVVLTHGNLLAEIDAVYQILSIDENVVVLGVLPLFHALAQMANLMLPLAAGGSVVFLETVNTTELLRALEQRGVTAFCCVPQFFYLIHERVMEQVRKSGRLKRTLFGAMLGTAGVLREHLGLNVGPRLFGRIHRVLGPHMRLLVTGGSRFDPRIGRDLYRLGFNILQAYGLTETSGAAAVLRPGDKHVASVGQPFPGVEIKIVPSSAAEEADASALVQTAAPAAIGEITIKGPVVSPGYYNRPDVNRETFRDGWLQTGDLGYLDNAGRLYVTGRAKEIIVTSSGKNIYPEEIETHYLQTPFIKELCVMGLSHPDEPAAERLHAVIVPDFELLRERKIVNAKEVLRFDIEGLSAQLPGHKRILSYDIVTEELPRTTTRKLKRFELARRLRETPRGAGAVIDPAPAVEITEAERAWAAEDHVREALAVVREAIQRPEAVRPQANLELDLGLDSMERVELLAQLEMKFGVEVTTEVSQKLYTVRELIEAVRPGAQAELSENARGESGTSWGELLAAPPEDQETLTRILTPHPFLNAVSYVAMKTVYAVAWLFLGLRVSGRENLPGSGPMLISPNHQSFLDGFLLTAALPARLLRRVFFVGASEYFETPARAAIARLLHIVPVDPDGNLLRAMRAGAYGLRSGNVLVLFPEGERSIDGRVKRFKKGAAILSTHLGAPIVPVGLEGLFAFWPRDRGPRWTKLLPFSGLRVNLRFGSPLRSTGATPDSEADYAGLTDRLRAAVAAMLPTESS